MLKKLVPLLITGLLLSPLSTAFAEEIQTEDQPDVLPIVEVQEEETMDVNSINEDVALTSGVYGGADEDAWEVADYWDMWRIQENVNAKAITRIYELINLERAKHDRNPVKLDQSLTLEALIRAAECNVVWQHGRPGGAAAKSLPPSGGEIICIGSYSPDAIFDTWMKSGPHMAEILAHNIDYVGVGNNGQSFVCVFDYSPGHDNKHQPVTESFLNTVDGFREDDVVAGIEYDIDFQAEYQPQNLKVGETTSLRPRIKTAKTRPTTHIYVKIAPYTVNWTSSDPTVASVDTNGVVTGLKNGTVCITGELNRQTITYNINITAPQINVQYRTHVQNVGWQGYVENGAMSGTSGRSLRLEGINVKLPQGTSGGIEYRTHVENIGWQGYVANGAMSGTSGQGLRLEAINIRLTGELAQKYDVYYRTHVQNFGWMGWAKNDEPSGSAGHAYRLEGIEIKIVEKGMLPPGITYNAYIER